MKKRDIPPFGLRLSPPLKKRTKDEAERNRHSMNTEIELLIEDGFTLREMRKKQRKPAP